MTISINKESDTPIYKQIVERIIAMVKSGEVPEGELLPSMNELAAHLDISKETVKKSYAILTERKLIEPHQGKGFYVNARTADSPKSILLILDKLSAYKQIMLRSLTSTLGDEYQITIRLHNQSVDLLQYYLDESLDLYDYYLISPHFPQNDDAARASVRQLKRIPYRKFIMLDCWNKDLPGNYGAVYQDFNHDIYDGLSQGLDDLKSYGRLNVISLASSLYHERISLAVNRFCRDNEIEVDFFAGVSPDCIKKGEAYLLLNSQLDSGLLDLVKEAEKRGLAVGKDLGIISYNDSPINQLVLGGLTTVSTDFEQMGYLAAKMILDGTMSKVRCDFRMTKRATF